MSLNWKTNHSIVALYHWISPVFDIRKFINGFFNYPRFLRDWVYYSRLPGAEGLHIASGRPCIHDWTMATNFDAHYIYLNAWALRKIIQDMPESHIDVGSQVSFVTSLSASLPVEFVDIRSLEMKISNLKCKKGSVLDMPYADRSVSSLSCLHVIEHIGLGRYGDELNPEGSRHAARELARVLGDNGKLYIGVPVGRRRVCFNAHRVLDPVIIKNWFEDEGLSLKSFSAVNDDGEWLEDLSPEQFAAQEYACGMYHFTRPIKG